MPQRNNSQGCRCFLMWARGRSHEHGEQKHSRLELTVKVTTFPLLLLWELISQTAIHISTQTTLSCSKHLSSPTEYSLGPCPISAAAVVGSFCACWQCPTWILHASYSMLSLNPRELALEVWGDSFLQRRLFYNKRLESWEKCPAPGPHSLLRSFWSAFFKVSQKVLCRIVS